MTGATQTGLSPTHPLDLTGRAVLVTGGNSGIGLGMARGLAAAGADICIWGRNPEKNAGAEKELSAFGTRVTVDVVDVADEASVVAGMVRCVENVGRLDACFANAAITGQMRNPRFLDSTLDEWRAVLRVDLDGTYLTLREAARHMIAAGEGGSLIATSSLAGQVSGHRVSRRTRRPKPGSSPSSARSRSSSGRRESGPTPYCPGGPARHNSTSGSATRS